MKRGLKSEKGKAVTFTLTVLALFLLPGTRVAAQQVFLPTVPSISESEHEAHVRADNGNHQPAPAAGLAHAFTINVYISGSGIDPSIVFVPAGRRVQLVLRNMSMSEHHYRVVGLPARDLLWVSEPGSGSAMPEESSDDEDHMMHHARDFVTSRATSPAGIRPTGREVHAYVSAARLVDILIFTATQTGTFAVQCDLHHQTLGKMVVFDAGETTTDVETTHHVGAPDDSLADPFILQRSDPVRVKLTRELGSVNYPDAPGVLVEATYAPAEYLTEICGGATPAVSALDPDRYHAILLTESVHEGKLPGGAEVPDVYVDGNPLPLIDREIVSATPQYRMTLYRFSREGVSEMGKQVVTLRLASGEQASWDLPSNGPNWFAWLAVAVGLCLIAWLAWTMLVQDQRRRANSFRLARATALLFLGVGAAWSWLFVVSRWGPEQRTDILTFKSGVTSKVMRALLKPAQGTGYQDHEATSVSGVYATPEYFLMTEQTEDAAKYQPNKFNVFYLFEDSHIGALGSSPPPTTLRLANGREFSPADATVLTTSPHHRATVFRFPSQDPQGQLIVNDQTPFFELVAQEPTADRPRVVYAAIGGTPATSAAQIMRWDLPIVYPKDLSESDLSLSTLFALLAGLLAVLSPCLLQLTVYYTFALTGIGMQHNLLGGNLAAVRSQVIRTAVQFLVAHDCVYRCRFSGRLGWAEASDFGAHGAMEPAAGRRCRAGLADRRSLGRLQRGSAGPLPLAHAWRAAHAKTVAGQAQGHVHGIGLCHRVLHLFRRSALYLVDDLCRSGGIAVAWCCVALSLLARHCRAVPTRGFLFVPGPADPALPAKGGIRRGAGLQRRADLFRRHPDYGYVSHSQQPTVPPLSRSIAPELFCVKGMSATRLAEAGLDPVGSSPPGSSAAKLGALRDHRSQPGKEHVVSGCSSPGVRCLRGPMPSDLSTKATAASGGATRHMSAQAPLPARSRAGAMLRSMRTVGLSKPPLCAGYGGLPATIASRAASMAFVSLAQCARKRIVPPAPRT